MKHKKVEVAKGYRLPHGYEVEKGSDKNKVYAKGGKIQSLKDEIAEYEALLQESSVPQDEKDFAKKEISEMQAKLAAMEDLQDESKGGSEKKTVTKKAKMVTKKEVTTENKAKKTDEDCDTLIKKAKERKKKAREAALERANAPKKSFTTKNKEAIEKVAEKVEKNVEAKIEKGELKKSELQKLIAEAEALVKSLKKKLSEI